MTNPDSRRPDLAPSSPHLPGRRQKSTSPLAPLPVGGEVELAATGEQHYQHSSSPLGATSPDTPPQDPDSWPGTSAHGGGVRALTVRQPWAWAIVHGGKNVENRTRNLAGSYRGPVAIHAGREWSSDGEHSELVARAYFEARQRQGWLVVDKEGAPRRAAAAGLGRFVLPDQFGAFVGVADLVDVHRCSALNVTREILCCESGWAEQPYDERHGGRRVPDLWHLEFANARPLDVPIPARGMLGLWTPPADVLEQLQAVPR